MNFSLIINCFIGYLSMQFEKKRKKKYFMSHAGFEPTTPLVKRPNSHLLSSCAPKCRWVRFVGFRNTSVSGSSPEPSVNVDGLQVFSITTFSFEVALSARSVDWAHVIWNQKKNYVKNGPHLNYGIIWKYKIHILRDFPESKKNYVFFKVLH